MQWLDGINYSLDTSLNKLWEIMKDRMPGILQSMGVTKSRTQLSVWTTTQELLDIVNVLFLELSSDKLHECSLYNYLLIHLMHISICILHFTLSVLSRSVAQLYLTLCKPMNCSMPGLPVHHQLLESTQTNVHRVGDAIQPSHPLSSPSPPALNLSQHQGLFK